MSSPTRLVPLSPKEVAALEALFVPTQPEKPVHAPRRAPAPRIPKAPTKTVAGLTWTKHVSESGAITWEAIDHLYRPKIWFGTSRRDMFCSVYHLDPRFKTIDPNRDRLSQDCLLNDVHPQGHTLDGIMADTAHMITQHMTLHEAKFLDAQEISGQDVEVGMFLHFKGVFSEISRLMPIRGTDYHAASFDNGRYPRDIHPERTYTVYVPKP